MLQKKDRGLSEGLTTLLLSAVTLVAIRLHLMGSKAPEFAPADNPAADCRWWLTRMLTFLHLPVLNAWLLLQPSVLSFDWSMEAVPLIHCLSDVRNVATVAFYTTLAYAAWRSLWRPDAPCPSDTSSAASSTAGSLRSERFNDCEADGVLDVTAVALSVLVLPFVPATNLFFYVGFVVAERVLYIPSMGYCLLVALGCQLIDDAVALRHRHHWWRAAFRCVLVVLLVAYGARTVRRNLDWLSEESLYRSGININPPKGATQPISYLIQFT